MKGEYVIYVDESGDQTLSHVNADYPLLVLVFCLFQVDDYVQQMVPAIQSLKFKHFGHDAVVLHERFLSRAKAGFHSLVDPVKRDEFMQELSGIVESVPFSIVAVTVDKRKLSIDEQNPYALALQQGLVLTRRFLQAQGCLQKRVPMVLESRGSHLDEHLLRACAPLADEEILSFDLLFADKKVNCCGLQIADLVARPIGRAILNPLQINRAFQTIINKLYQSQFVLFNHTESLLMEFRGSVG
jgi:hypothetical protein